MTWLYAETFGSDEESHQSFVTSDDYPHISNREGNDLPFHLLRVGDKVYYTYEMLMLVLECALGGFEFLFHTECPEIETMEYEDITYKGIKAALLDFGRNIVVSTVVVPEGDKVNTP